MCIFPDCECENTGNINFFNKNFFSSFLYFFNFLIWIHDHWLNKVLQVFLRAYDFFVYFISVVCAHARSKCKQCKQNLLFLYSRPENGWVVFLCVTYFGTEAKRYPISVFWNPFFIPFPLTTSVLLSVTETPVNFLQNLFGCLEKSLSSAPP